MIGYDILIPAYNAELTLPLLIHQIRQLSIQPQNIFLIDDYSQDLTVKIAEELKCRVTVNLRNTGKGYTLRKGYELFLKESKAPYLICIDADLQHPVDKISDFLDVIQKENVDIVIGNRDKSLKNMPLSRILSNSITSYIISIMTGKKILDSQCGFRAIKRGVLENIKLKENGFQMESEFIFRANDLNYKIQFVNIPTIYGGQTSYIHHFKDTMKFIKLIFRELLGKNV